MRSAPPRAKRERREHTPPHDRDAHRKPPWSGRATAIWVTAWLLASPPSEIFAEAPGVLVELHCPGGARAESLERAVRARLATLDVTATIVHTPRPPTPTHDGATSIGVDARGSREWTVAFLRPGTASSPQERRVSVSQQTESAAIEAVAGIVASYVAAAQQANHATSTTTPAAKPPGPPTGSDARAATDGPPGLDHAGAGPASEGAAESTAARAHASSGAQQHDQTKLDPTVEPSSEAPAAGGPTASDPPSYQPWERPLEVHPRLMLGYGATLLGDPVQWQHAAVVEAGAVFNRSWYAALGYAHLFGATVTDRTVETGLRRHWFMPTLGIRLLRRPPFGVEVSVAAVAEHLVRRTRFKVQGLAAVPDRSPDWLFGGAARLMGTLEITENVEIALGVAASVFPLYRLTIADPVGRTVLELDHMRWLATLGCLLRV